MTPDPWPHRDTTGLPAWDERIRALRPPSIDLTQLDARLALTPTQRLEKVQALVAPGEARLTHAVDILCGRDRANLERLVKAIAPLHPQALARNSVMPLFGREMRVLDREGLEHSKLAAGLAKDLLDLEVIAALRQRA